MVLLLRSVPSGLPPAQTNDSRGCPLPAARPNAPPLSDDYILEILMGNTKHIDSKFHYTALDLHDKPSVWLEVTPRGGARPGHAAGP